jgi:hypothetical protein
MSFPDFQFISVAIMDEREIYRYNRGNVNGVNLPPISLSAL